MAEEKKGKGTYNGRLAFDPETNLHIAETFDERPLTDDEKKARVAELVALGVTEEKASEIADSEKGKAYHAVVTDDEGQTWRYATDDDDTHFDKYHVKFANVDTTANELVNLEVEHGREKAAEILRQTSPHHFEVQPDDAHYEQGATTDGAVTHTRLQSVPHKRSTKRTSHTAAWKGDK